MVSGGHRPGGHPVWGPPQGGEHGSRREGHATTRQGPQRRRGRREPSLAVPPRPPGTQLGRPPRPPGARLRAGASGLRPWALLWRPQDTHGSRADCPMSPDCAPGCLCRGRSGRRRASASSMPARFTSLPVRTLQRQIRDLRGEGDPAGRGQVCPCLGGKTGAPVPALGQTSVWDGPPRSHQQSRCTAPGAAVRPHLPSGPLQPCRGDGQLYQTCHKPRGGAPASLSAFVPFAPARPTVFKPGPMAGGLLTT